MRRPLTIPRPPRVVLLRRRGCASAERALELLGYTGAKLEVRELDERGPDMDERRALVAALGEDVVARGLARDDTSFVLLPETGRASLLESPERALELFAIPLPEGETEGSFMRRVLQNRLA